MEFKDIFGYIAGACTTAAFIPQVIKVVKTRETKDLSLGMFGLTTLGVAMWLTYGIVLGALPIIIANSITLCLAVFILVMKIRLG
jgi:MtN3 and saliva related transmembrane protein